MATINRPNIPSGATKINPPTTREPGSIYRGDNVNPEPNIDPNNNYVLPNPGVWEQDGDGHQTVRSRILYSAIYKQAYELFAYLEDTTWAQRLLAIVDSASQSAQSWFDTIGLSQKAEQANEITYQTCIQQIGALIAEYQSYVNSLPSTQKQQYSDAGVNVALNPSVLSGSSISERAAGASPLSGVEVDNTSDNIMSLLQFAGNLQGGLVGIVNSGVSVFNALSQFDIQNRSLGLTEAESGAPISKPFKGKQNRENLFISYGDRLTARSREDAARADRAITSQNEAEIAQNESWMRRAVSMQEFSHFEDDLGEVLRDLGSLSYENWKAQFNLQSLRNKREKAQLDFESQVVNDLSPELESSYRNSMNQFGVEENNVRETLRSSYKTVVERMAEKARRGSWINSLLLMNLYNQGNLGIQDALETGAGVVGKFINPVHKTKVLK